MPRAIPSTSVFEQHPRLTVFALLTFGFFTLDFVITYAVDLLPGFSNPFNAELIIADRDKGYRQNSSVYHHDLKANASSDNAVWGSWVYKVYTDSLGFKSDSVKSTPLSSERHRIIFIGDSFTEGIGFDYESTFVGRIAQALSDNGIDVLNAGVSSYSPIIYWRKLKYLIEDTSLEFDEVLANMNMPPVWIAVVGRSARGLWNPSVETA
jgi:hypothetical protein